MATIAGGDDGVMRAVVAELRKLDFRREFEMEDHRKLLGLHIEQLPEVMAREIGRQVYRLSAYVWADRIQHEEKVVEHFFRVEWPASWWEHLKQRWFPKWALRRWPVKMHVHTATRSTKVTFECHALLPGFHYQPPPGGDSDDYVLKTGIASEDLPRKDESFGDYMKRREKR